MGKKMKEVFMMAVGYLAVRDMEGDEPRNVAFIHMDPRDEETQKYLGWFTDFEDVDFPDVIWRSNYRHVRLGFKLAGTVEEDAQRLMK